MRGMHGKMSLWRDIETIGESAEMEMVNIKINGVAVSAPKGATILEAAREAGFEIPTLCFLKEINEIGACRICVVEVKGARTLIASCVYPIAEGMEINTVSPRVQNARKRTLQLILSNHNKRCLSCVRSSDCELQKLCRDFGIEDEDYYQGERVESEVDRSAAHMVRDDSKCILCRRCVAACAKQQAVGVIGANNRGFATNIGCAFDLPLNEVACVNCGQCVVVCPTGALVEKDHTQEVWQAIADPAKHVVVQTAPAVRATLGECFGMPVGTSVTGKMVAALRRMGFDRVFDTDFAADVTILEEASEFLHRLQNDGVLPLITSCSPGWISYCEHYFPEFIPNLSSCKSPQQMLGAIIKTWYVEKMGLKPADIVVVSVMPCTAKKYEINRPDESAAGGGIPDVDIALTTRELGRMIERAGIDFKALPDEDFDSPLGESTGAATIFGVTGGVMEAALRTAVEWVTGEELKTIHFTDVRGMAGIKEASYHVAGIDLKVAVCSGLANAKTLLENIKYGELNYQFIEIMGCPGGCVNGGGQPLQPAGIRNFTDLRGTRAKALYAEDESKTLRKSHANPAVQRLYEEYFTKPGSHKAHEVLHTTYSKKERF